MIRHKRPDRKNALSIIDAAERDMKFTLSIDITEDSGSTIARNIYECFRMLGDAILVSKGIESKDHLAPIKEIISINVKTDRSLNLIDNLRRLRHNINYYGYTPTIYAVNDAISIANSIFKPLLVAIRSMLKE